MSLRAFLVVLVVSVAGAIPTRAALIYSLDSDGAWQSTAGSTWLAQTFSTGSAAMTLNSVSAWIRNATENNASSTPSSVTLSLYATDGNSKPTGSSLLTLINNQSIGAWGDGNISATSLSFSLSANTTYAVVMSGSAGGTIGWKYQGATSPTSTISPTPTFYNWRSTDSGTSWSDAAPSSGFNMIVNASAAAVPEPGTWAAAALLVGGAGFMRWRKRNSG